MLRVTFLRVPHGVSVEMEQHTHTHTYTHTHTHTHTHTQTDRPHRLRQRRSRWIWGDNEDLGRVTSAALLRSGTSPKKHAFYPIVHCAAFQNKGGKKRRLLRGVGVF